MILAASVSHCDLIRHPNCLTDRVTLWLCCPPPLEVAMWPWSRSGRVIWWVWTCCVE